MFYKSFFDYSFVHWTHVQETSRSQKSWHCLACPFVLHLSSKQMPKLQTLTLSYNQINYLSFFICYSEFCIIPKKLMLKFIKMLWYGIQVLGINLFISWPPPKKVLFSQGCLHDTEFISCCMSHSVSSVFVYMSVSTTKLRNSLKTKEESYSSLCSHNLDYFLASYPVQRNYSMIRQKLTESIY